MKIKKNSLIPQIIVIAFIVFVVITLSLFVLFCCFAFIPLKVDDVNKYLETDGLKSPLAIFPASIDGTGEVLEYHYYDYRLKGGSEIILSMQYDNDSFIEEVNRLEHVECDVFGKINSVVKDADKKLFNYCTYIAEYRPMFCQFEYACVDYEKQTIHYIRLDHISLEHLSIEQSLLPKFYFDDSEIYSEYEFCLYA